MRTGLAMLLAIALAAPAQAAPRKPAATVCASCLKAHVAHLASDALRGRRCGTADEARAADYLVSEMKALGLRGAAPAGGFLQTVRLSAPNLAAPAALAVAGPGAPLTLTQGREFVALAQPRPLAGRLVRVTDASHLPADLAGAIAFHDPAKPDAKGRAALLAAGALAVLEVAPAPVLAQWDASNGRWRRMTVEEPAAAPASAPALRLLLKPEAAEALRGRDGAAVRLDAVAAEPTRGATQNVLAVIHGRAPDADRHALLLSAHYDHLGVRDGVLYPGANDDASGTAAVLELARVLKVGARPRRTVYFALFGCEEEGELGSLGFQSRPPMPSTDLAANLEFEMIGFPDPKRPDTLMVTGWERSDLGPTLAAHGAKLGPDLYPEQNFFQRSDNYQLALKGVVAHTISAWPTPPTYHQPSDTVASLDLAFMTGAVRSLIDPVRWLANSDFKPQWTANGRP